MSYQRAGHILDAEWFYATHVGRLMAKAGADPRDYLPHMARACHLANLHYG